MWEYTFQVTWPDTYPVETYKFVVDCYWKAWLHIAKYATEDASDVRIINIQAVS